MRSLKIASLVLAAFGCAAFLALAQDTNLPPTEFQFLLQQSNTVLVRGFTVLGSVPLGNATVAINAQEGNDVTHGLKKYAVAIVLSEIDQNGQRGGLPLIVDYGELDSLVGAIDYLGKATASVSQLNGFEATYVTKSGFRIISHSDRREGTVNLFIQFNDYSRIPLTSDQLNQIRNLIVQAKTTIDGIK